MSSRPHSSTARPGDHGRSSPEVSSASRTDIRFRTVDPPRREGEVRHYFTVDVEEYFQVSALDGVVGREQWTELESRVVPSLEKLLALLDEAGAKGTFFILGWTADRHPSIAPLIHEAGHEIASHGWGHRKVTTLTPDQFRESLRRTKELLEDQSGAPVRGYRAPSFSIVPGHEWAFDVLIEEGHAYDSSLFPIRRPDYGYPGAPTDPHVIDRPSGSIVEYPLATLQRMGMRLPAAGGGYFRLLPYGVTAAALADYERRGAAGTFYIHPWEWDPEQPRFPTARWTTRLRHYGGLQRTWPRLQRLLKEFRFTSIAASEAIST